jgi:hypothetical protein
MVKTLSADKPPSVKGAIGKIFAAQKMVPAVEVGLSAEVMSRRRIQGFCN